MEDVLGAYGEPDEIVHLERQVKAIWYTKIDTWIINFRDGHCVNFWVIPSC